MIRVYMATYYPSFTVSVPATAWIDGNTISFDISTPTEVAMPIIGLVAVVMLIITVFSDRRLTGTLRTKRRK